MTDTATPNERSPWWPETAPIAIGETVRWTIRGQHWKTGRRWETTHEGRIIARVPRWTNVSVFMLDGLYEAHRWPFVNRSSVERYLVSCNRGAYYRCPVRTVIDRQNPDARRVA